MDALLVLLPQPASIAHTADTPRTTQQRAARRQSMNKLLNEAAAHPAAGHGCNPYRRPRQTGPANMGYGRPASRLQAILVTAVREQFGPPPALGIAAVFGRAAHQPLMGRASSLA